MSNAYDNKGPRVEGLEPKVEAPDEKYIGLSNSAKSSMNKAIRKALTLPITGVPAAFYSSRLVDKYITKLDLNRVPKFDDVSSFLEPHKIYDPIFAVALLLYTLSSIDWTREHLMRWRKSKREAKKLEPSLDEIAFIDSSEVP
ncbi:MAG: hypothetical protein IH934_03960 [Nanoarchaeota archaeon]|nr:hypothetical protein [Nanoarchaeota archaeon]